jgi:membrane-bound serine protease (ClpP class)
MVGGEPALAGALPDNGSIIGETGIAATALFPSGQVDIGGRRYEARLDMGYADAGTKVKVTGRAEFGLTVEVVS